MNLILVGTIFSEVGQFASVPELSARNQWYTVRIFKISLAVGSPGSIGDISRDSYRILGLGGRLKT